MGTAMMAQGTLRSGGYDFGAGSIGWKGVVGYYWATRVSATSSIMMTFGEISIGEIMNPNGGNPRGYGVNFCC